MESRIKEILEKHKHPNLLTIHRTQFDIFAEEISTLAPQSDRNKLLTPEEIRKIVDFVYDLDMMTGIEGDEKEHLETAVIEGAKAQRAKNEAEFQARLEQIKKELEILNPMLLRFDAIGNSYTEIPLKDTIEWQSFWKQEGID